MSIRSDDYAALRAAVSPPARKRKWWKAIRIGCGAYLGLLVIGGIFNALTDPPSPATPPAVPTVDSVATATASDSLPLGASAPVALPVAPPATEPVAEPSVTNEPPPAPPKRKEVTVYTTRTGSKYHRASCSSLRKSSYATPLSEARQYYDPCGRCRPPR